MERASWEKRLAVRLFDASSPLWAWAIRRKTGTPPAEPRRITVLAFWGIGDAVLLTPLLRALRRRYPGTWIELIGKSFLRDLFAHDSCVNEITVYAPPWVAFTQKYRFWSPKYVTLILWLGKRRGAENDWVVTTRGDIREHLVAAAMGGRRRFGYDNGGGARLLTDTFPYLAPKERQRHYAEYNSEVGGMMGCPEDGRGPRLMLLEDERQKALDFLRRSGWQGERPLVGGRTIREFHLEPGVEPMQMCTTLLAFFLPIHERARHELRTCNWVGIKRLGQVASAKRWNDVAVALFEEVLAKGGVWHLWGHSWQIEENALWQDLEALLANIAHREGVRYLINGQVAREAYCPTQGSSS